MPPIDLLLGPAGRVINRMIALDPEAAERLAPLEGRRLRLRLEQPAFTVDATFTLEGLALAAAGDDDPPADVTVSGRLADLLALARDPDAAGGRLRFDGDPTVAQQARRFFRELDVDWEEALAAHLGDAPAHQLGRLLRSFADWGRHGAAATGETVTEYLTEERRDLPSRPEVDAFLDDVDRLRADSDRLAARIARLERAHRGGAR